jgi:acetolactate synthase-1/2/3 large subunit
MLDRRIQMRIDHDALFAPLTKATLPLSPGNVARAISQALTLSRTEPPGPVHLDLPEDVALEPATEGELSPLSPFDLAAVEPQAFEHLQTLLKSARRPLLVTGLDLTRAKNHRRLLEFIEAQQMPWITTLHAKGFLPESHALYAGVLGRARRSDVQRLVDRADLIVAVGYDPIEINYEEWVGDRPIVHIGTEAAEMSPELLLPVNAGGDLADAIEALAALPASENDWTLEEVREHRENLDGNLRPEGTGFAPHDVIDVLRERLPSDAILAYDVGAHTHQIATQWRTDEAFACYSTNGWSSMGFGMPAAYAAKLMHPERTVVGLIGDGCFAMTVGELTMARRLNLNVPIVVLNDGWLSLIKIKQQRRELGVDGVRLGEPPPSPAHYFGVPVRPAHDAGSLNEALDWALSLAGPSVVEAFVNGEAYLQTVYD